MGGRDSRPGSGLLPRGRGVAGSGSGARPGRGTEGADCRLGGGGGDAPVEIKARPPFVSRGGEKLAHALEAFGISVAGRTCLDVGASTGGFTPCPPSPGAAPRRLLPRGAARVYAVDVGWGQLHAALRADPRVVLMEKTNARTLTAAVFPVEPDLATVDVAFISLEKVLRAVMGALADPAEAVGRMPPQFEVGKGLVGKGGVVRDPAQHRAVVGRLGRRA